MSHIYEYIPRAISYLINSNYDCGGLQLTHQDIWYFTVHQTNTISSIKYKLHIKSNMTASHRKLKYLLRGNSFDTMTVNTISVNKRLLSLISHTSFHIWGRVIAGMNSGLKTMLCVWKQMGQCLCKQNGDVTRSCFWSQLPDTVIKESVLKSCCSNSAWLCVLF